MNDLCLTVDTDGWDRGRIPERIRLQAALVETIETACRRSGFPGGAAYRPYSGGGMYLVLPDGRRPAAGIPSLIRELRAALAEANGPAAAASRIRLRLALTTGLVLPPGIAGRAVAEGLRLVNSEPVRAALRRMPETDLAVIVSDSFYRETVERGLPPLLPEECSRIALGEGFPSTAWLHVPDAHPASERKPDPDAASTSDPPDRTARTEPARPSSRIGELMARAANRTGADDDRRAIQDLETALRLLPAPDAPGAEEALLRLGACHHRTGDLEAAAQTWLFLLAWHPLSAEAYRRLGRLELRRGREALAATYLKEGLRLIRARPELSPAPGRVACALLLDLSDLEDQRGNQVAADARLNEAAEADPASPFPLVSLACRAAAEGDEEGARRLFGTALARIPGPEEKKIFLREHSQSNTKRPGSEVIMKVLLEYGLDPAVSHRTSNAPRPSSA